MRWEKRHVLTLIGLAVAGYVLIVGSLWAVQRRLLYLPDQSNPSRAAAGVVEMQEVRIGTEDGLSLLAWWRPPQGEQAVILYLHGNGGHIGYRGGRVRPFLDGGYGVLLIEYRGYGGNRGSPSEAGLYADARAAVAYLRGQQITPERIVVYGESLGSAVAVATAADMGRGGLPFAAIILEAPVSSVMAVGSYHYPWVPVRWLLKDRFDAVSRIGQVAAPILVVHGDDDEIVPIRFGRQLFEVAPEPKEAVWLNGGGHEDLPAFGLQPIVLDFLQRHTAGTR